MPLSVAKTSTILHWLVILDSHPTSIGVVLRLFNFFAAELLNHTPG